ncbi:MAG: hypothetical protein U0905_06145 [Pirellulales bacterium]
MSLDTLKTFQRLGSESLNFIEYEPRNVEWILMGVLACHGMGDVAGVRDGLARARALSPQDARIAEMVKLPAGPGP